MSKVKYIELKEDKEILRIIADATHTIVNQCGIKNLPELATATIGVVFLEEMIKYVKETGTPINFCQILDFALEDGEVFAGPGQEFKLLVKSDEKSETV